MPGDEHDQELDSDAEKFSFWGNLPHEIAIKIVEYLIVPPQVTDLEQRLRRAHRESTFCPDYSDDVDGKTSEDAGLLRRSKRLRLRQRTPEDESDTEEIVNDANGLLPGVNLPCMSSIAPSDNLLKLWFPNYEMFDAETLHTSFVHGPLALERNVPTTPPYAPGVSAHMECVHPEPRWDGHPIAASRSADFKIVENLVTLSQVSRSLRDISNDELVWKRANKWLYQGKQAWNTAGPLVPHGLCAFGDANGHLLQKMTWQELEGLVVARVRCGMLDGWSVKWLEADADGKQVDVSDFYAIRTVTEEKQLELGGSATAEQQLSEFTSGKRRRLQRVLQLVQVSEPGWLDPFMGEAPRFNSIFKYSFAVAMMDGRRDFITGHEMTTSDWGLAFFHHGQWGMRRKDSIVCRFGRDGRYRSPWIRDDDEAAIPLDQETRPHRQAAGLQWSLNGHGEENMYFTELGRPSADPLPRLPSQLAIVPVVNAFSLEDTLESVLSPNQTMGLHQFCTKGLLSRAEVDVDRQSMLSARQRRNCLRIGPYPPLSVRRADDWSWRATNGVALMSTISELGSTPVVWRGPWWIEEAEDEVFGEFME